MPKVAYSEEEREQLRLTLLENTLRLIAKQGIQHTTVEQIYRSANISRTFFYSFFSSKEELVIEALYLQQPKLIAYAAKLTADTSLSWKDALRQFLYACCYGEQYGIAVMSIEEQQQLFQRMSPDCCRTFREKQFRLFGDILRVFGVHASMENIQLFTNLFLSILILRKAMPQTLPLLVPEAADRTVAFQLNALIDAIETIKHRQPSANG